MSIEPVEYLDEESEDVRPGWRIGSIDEADWALKRIADLKAEISENEAVIQAHIARLKVRLENLNSRAANGIGFFESRLREYAEANRGELLKGGKKKSRTLPHGSIGWRKKGGGFEVKDPVALLAWAQTQPVEMGLVRIKEEPAIAQIKAYVEKSGELPPGTDLKEETEEFSVKTTEVSDGDGKH